MTLRSQSPETNVRGEGPEEDAHEVGLEVDRFIEPSIPKGMRGSENACELLNQ